MPRPTSLTAPLPLSAPPSAPPANGGAPVHPPGQAATPASAAQADRPWGLQQAPPAALTASGLARRVRGANLPVTPPRRPAEPEGPRRSADEVYGLLSSFTNGVRRGLDDVHNRAEREE
jgi:hypothetical protein